MGLERVNGTREDKCSKIRIRGYLQENWTRKNFFFISYRLPVLNLLVSAGHIYNDPPRKITRAHHAPRGAIPGRVHHGSYLCIAMTITGRRYPTKNLTVDSENYKFVNSFANIYKNL